MVAAIAALKTKLSDFISRESATLLARRVDEIEIRIRVGKEKVPLRLVATSMSGQWLKVDMYKESLDSSSGKAEQFCLYGPNGEEQACFLEPYPQPGALQQSALLRVPSAPRTFSISSVSSKRLWSSTGARTLPTLVVLCRLSFSAPLSSFSVKTVFS